MPICDAVAKRVRDALITAGVETPFLPTELSTQQKQLHIKDNITQILTTLGLDLSDDSLCDTPERVAKMYVEEIFAGLEYVNFPKITLIDNKMHVDEMIQVSQIGVTSTCEHHLVTIDGLAKVAYFPQSKLIGLSKINRVVHFFAQRPQVQERLTQQILVALQTLLETKDVAVSIDAVHYCIKARGIMDSQSATKTMAFGGVFKTDPSHKQMFLNG